MKKIQYELCRKKRREGQRDVSKKRTGKGKIKRTKDPTKRRER